MEVIIRKLKIEDADQISRIYGDITQKPVKIDFKNVIEHDVVRAEDSSFVAELNGKIIGFMISYVLNLGFGIEKSAWIATLGVSPKFMGQGIGEQLAKAIFQFYQSTGIKDVYTSVRWDSTDLLSFFKTLGFDRSNFINLCKGL
ncbi:MAG: GNAT family N-acetyltransferase [Deltaproteobacteria bacterium RBG_13_49_15]|nr:MAG: GNAT family N-acetyltransferase [Deltaproteobacteria bacterium RBG_13_49_15]